MSVDDLDRALEGLPIAPPTLTGAKGRPKHCRPGTHVWHARARTPEHVDHPDTRHDCFAMACPGYRDITPEGYRQLSSCTRCGIVRNDQASRRGRAVGQRSKREERRLAKVYGGTRTGHLGGAADFVSDLLVGQSKAGTGWWSKRYAAELDYLPRTGGRSPVLVISNGEPGHLVRRLVVIDERDFRALFGDRILDGSTE